MRRVEERHERLEERSTRYLLPDAGLRLVQRYIAACEALSRTPDTDIVERFKIVLVRPV